MDLETHDVNDCVTIRATYSRWAGGAFVEGQACRQDVVEPRKKTSDLWRRNQHVKSDRRQRSRNTAQQLHVKTTIMLFKNTEHVISREDKNFLPTIRRKSSVRERIFWHKSKCKYNLEEQF